MALLVISIVVLWLGHRSAFLKNAYTVLSAITLPVQYAVHWPIKGFDLLRDALTTNKTLKQENTVLKNELFKLSLDLQQLQSLQAENKYLYALLGSLKKLEKKGLIAEILRVDADPLSHKFILNKGQNAGLKVGQPLLDAYGIMGQIIEVNPHTSTALLITDVNHAIPAKVNRTGTRLVVEGTGSYDELVAYHVSSAADIREGDLLVTSGLGRLFPAGFPIGTVTKVVQESGQPFTKIIAKPIAKLDGSQPILLIQPTS